MNPNGQISIDSVFGQLLTERAKEADIIVEIGCWLGQGSTLCIARGLLRPEQQFYSIESEIELLTKAKSFYNDSRIHFLHGRITDTMPPFQHPNPAAIEWYNYEKAVFQSVPKILDQIPSKIDLLVLDGSDFCSREEFLILAPRSRVIFLDDTNPTLSLKNVQNRLDILADKDWEVLYDHLEDRNGAFAARRGKFSWVGTANAETQQ